MQWPRRDITLTLRESVSLAQWRKSFVKTTGAAYVMVFLVLWRWKGGLNSMDDRYHRNSAPPEKISSLPSASVRVSSLPPGSERQRHVPNPKKVLVVDDDEAFGQMTRMRLEKAGYRARFHRGPFGALHALRESAADLVILDVGMPGLDGPQVLRLIRSVPSLEKTRVVLYSGIEPEALKSLASAVGATTVMKASAWSTLLEAVERALA